MPVNFRSLQKRGKKGDGFQWTLAQRCRDLSQIAALSEVREQLREWVDDFEAEAEAVERRQPQVDL